jgi:hypothetical protein
VSRISVSILVDGRDNCCIKSRSTACSEGTVKSSSPDESFLDKLQSNWLPSIDLSIFWSWKLWILSTKFLEISDFSKMLRSLGSSELSSSLSVSVTYAGSEVTSWITDSRWIFFSLLRYLILSLTLYFCTKSKNSSVFLSSLWSEGLTGTVISGTASQTGTWCLSWAMSESGTLAGDTSGICSSLLKQTFS